MDKKIIKKVVDSLPCDSAQYAVRDITILACSIFGETHFVPLKKIFGFNFKINFWHSLSDKQVIFYRSGKEYDLFAKRMGLRCLKEKQFARNVSNILIKKSDQINLFIKENNTLEKLIKSWNDFFVMYRDFFAYHQVVYWSSEYLTKAEFNKVQKEKIKKIVPILERAYKYNETVVPNVEKYINKLRIGHLVYSEINNNVYNNIKSKPKQRGLLWLGRKMQVLSPKDSSQIDKAIKEKYKKYLKNIKQIKGLGVSKGVIKGKIKLITNLDQLKNCRKGDILVTSMTRPQYNTFIKKVSAIVTDEGGLLCHASMLAREFKIPCVVGTKNATKVLKNGDLVQVDANKGIVKKIK